MKRTLPYLTALIVAGLLAHAPAFAQEGKAAAKPIATVNGVAIPKSRVDALMSENKAQGAPDNAEVRAMVRDELVMREILTQEAKKKGFDKKSEVVGQIDLARQALTIRAYMQDFVKTHPVTDEMVKQEYDALIKATANDKEYKVRHILLESEQEAKDTVAALQKGGKFEDLAKQSKDLGTKDKGGDLGWSHPSGYVKPFGDALVKQEKGKFSAEPVKSEFGYHIILVEDTRDMKQPALDEVKPQIQQRLQSMIVQKHFMDLRTKAKVE
jgi:peptidyl-prolyl cis-trans isomerase C